MKFLTKALAISFLAVLLVACDNDDDNNSGANGSSNGAITENIVEVARSNGSFNTLIAALEATGLDATLASADSTFTVFAPTDEAFDALPDGTLDALLADTDTLSDILLYHVVAEADIDSDAAIDAAGTTLATANNDEIAVSLDGNTLLINTAQIVTSDVAASNGTIHAIDSVLLPPDDQQAATMNIVEIASVNENFSTLVAALSATSDLVATLSDENASFTVFAPTNAAFEALPAGTLDTLLAAPDGTLRDILLKHVVTGAVDSVTAFSLNGTDVETVGGETVNLIIDAGELTIDGATIISYDIQATNGIIHVIDAVIALDE